MRLLPEALLLVGLMLLLPPGSAVGQVINACVKPNGNLQIVADPTACGNNEKPLSWNIQGPPGPPGEPGMEGEEGPPGPTLRVFDATGAEIGIYGDGSPDARFLNVFLESSRVLVGLTADGNMTQPSGASILYEDPSCDGSQGLYVQPEDGFVGGFLRNTAEGLVAIENGIAPTLTFIAGVINAPGGDCLAVGRDMLVVPVRTADLGLSFPLSAPLYVGLPPD